ncbi:MAG: hypothetical protein LBT77_02305 [Mycoplasmataceae bacterium]|nr:hypothetical protein [Mycoplasmataceae bacterium]
MKIDVLIFIIIGFAGALFMILLSILNLYFYVRYKNKIFLLERFLLTLTNLCFFVYALGLSIVNIHTIFYNSMPTWVGSGISLLVNTFVLFAEIWNQKNSKKRRS